MDKKKNVWFLFFIFYFFIKFNYMKKISWFQTPKPPKPIISTPVKSLPQENKQNTSKNEGPWKKINPGTEPVQLTFLDELEAQEKLKNEAMKQQRLKELQIASSAKVKSS